MWSEEAQTKMINDASYSEAISFQEYTLEQLEEYLIQEMDQNFERNPLLSLSLLQKFFSQESSLKSSPEFYEAFTKLAPLKKLQKLIVEINDPAGRTNISINGRYFKRILQILREVLKIWSAKRNLLDKTKLKNVMYHLYMLVNEKQWLRGFKTQFLRLSIKTFEIAPEIISIQFLSFHVHDQMKIVEEYYKFMETVFKNDLNFGRISWDTFQLLEKGFIKRVNIDLQTKNLIDYCPYFNCISSCIEASINWYKSNSKQSIILRKFIENTAFIQIAINFSIAMQRYKFIEQILSFLVDDRERDYQMKINRYECILHKIVKVFMKKSNLAFISLDYSCLISDENGFEQWWVKTEFVSHKLSDFIDTYTHNRGGIRFVLGMVANFIFDFPDKRDIVIQFFNEVDFAAQIKFNLDDEVIRNLLSSYYGLIGDIQSKETIELLDFHDTIRKLNNS